MGSMLCICEMDDMAFSHETHDHIFFPFLFHL